MKHIGSVILLALAMALSACGGGSSSTSSGNVNGSWTASLTNPDGTPAFGFTTSFTQSSGNSSVTVSNFTFSTSGDCFSTSTTQTGSFAFSGNFNGNVTGTFQMTISTVPPTDNVLTLQGTVNGGTISGTWALTGQTGCSGSGTFTMTQM